MSRPRDASGIAIIGMACRFPGADNLATFWANLCQGVESISFFSDAELLAAGVEPAVLHQPNYVKAAPILRDIDKFDASFFALSPKEAALMDPQQRLFLEVAWEAFEDAGYHPPVYDGAVGVFAGSGGVITSYLMEHREQLTLPGDTAGIQHIGNDKDFLSTRVSYKFNLCGPSVTVQTACSTSLVAVHLACQSLRSGECVMALAGASTIRVPHLRGYWVEKGNIHSLDGHCRAFDAAGQGTIFGSGVAAVLLKNVQDAVAAGDHIYAVIKGTAINNDGAGKVSYTAPSAAGQARAMMEAFARAAVLPQTVGYVECHATGTIVGDPVEIQALTQAFRKHTTQTQYCAIGSVKTNIGHPEQTAGLAGLIKTALILKHQRIPPSLHFVTPNPNIDFVHSPFYVNTVLRDWPTSATPRRAAVNSLGIGGTNAFAVLEEAPPSLPEVPGNERALHLCSLSAKNAVALRTQAEQLRGFLQANPYVPLADVCYTTNVSRSYFGHRFAVTTESSEALQAQLAAFVAGTAASQHCWGNAPRQAVVFLFPGQGAQYAGMAETLYQTQPTFRAAFDACDAYTRPYLEHALRDVLFATDDRAALLHETVYTQPALFAVEYALAQLWQAWGVVPEAVLGHSLGEIVAACVAGVFELCEALQLVLERGRLMQSLPRHGAMAVVSAAESVVQDLLRPYADRVAIAAVNGPHNTVISGPRETLAMVCQALQGQDILSTTLAVSQAFHSPLLDSILETFEAVASQVTSRAPRLPLLSNVTGKPLEQAPSPRYWRDHMRYTVRFAECMHTLEALGYTMFLEVGPGSTLRGMGRQCLPSGRATWLSSLGKGREEWHTMLESLQQLYLAGATINWEMVHQGYARRRLALPTYPFQRQRYWLDTPASGTTHGRTASPPGTHPLLGRRLRSALKERQFEAIYSLEHLPYLADHRMHGTVVLPTTAGLETALAAGQAHFGPGTVMIEHLVYHAALALPDEGERLVHTIVTPQGPERAAFQLLSTSRDGHDEWQMHLSGVLLHQEGQPVADSSPFFMTPALHTRCPQHMSAASFYRLVSAPGLGYGSTFQGVQQLWRGAGEVVSHVRLPAALTPGSYGLHPALLDACLHTYLALSSDYGKASVAYLPFAIERFWCTPCPLTEGWSHVTLTQPADDHTTLTLDIRLYDTTGNLVAVFDGVSARQMPSHAFLPQAEKSYAAWLYHMRWEARPALPSLRTVSPRVPTSWLLFADAGGFAAALAEHLCQRGEHCHLVTPGTTFSHDANGHWTIDASAAADFHRLLREVAADEPFPCHSVLYLWGLDMPPMAAMTLERLSQAEIIGIGGALFLTQALAASRMPSHFAPRLWFITRAVHNPDGATGPLEVAQAPLWGLGRTVQLEHPPLWGGLIDLPGLVSSTFHSDAAAVLAEILQGDGEDQVALREETRFVARLAPLPQDSASPTPIQFHACATYLITGGLGMLGLKIAHWLVTQQGVRYVVLTGRREPQDTAQSAIHALEALGAHVRVVRADVTVESDVQRLMAEIRQHLPPLKGVFHGAGVLEDGILSQGDWHQFTRATAPKIKGSWLLHHYTQQVDLDLFVLLSSVLSLLGSPGQANYTAGNAFLDALVEYRRALGLAAMAINSGPWDEAGMATAAGDRGRTLWSGRGMQYIAPEDGMRVFADLIRRQVPHAAVTITDWAVYMQQLPVCPPVYTALLRTTNPTAQGDGIVQQIQTRLQQASPPEQRRLLLDFIGQQIRQALGFDKDMDPRQPLHELGMDSLMSVTVVNRLEAVLGMPIPVVKLIVGPSLEQFVDDLLPALTSLAETTHPLDITPANNGMSDAAATVSLPQTIPATVARSGNTVGNGWLVFHKPNPTAQIRLFCFPFAGGGAAAYRSWAEALEPAIEVVGIDPPGRASRIHEPPLMTTTDFLQALVPVLLPYLDKPFAFYGHCLGGLTLFETARALLEEHQVRVEHILVSGARPPHRGTQFGPFEEAMLADVLRHKQYDPFLPPYEQPDEVFMDILRHFRLGATEEFLQQPELRVLLLPTIRAEFAMASQYQCTVETPWDIPITCFTGLDDVYVTRADAMAWSRFTTSVFTIYMRQGTHFLLVDDRDFILETIKRALSTPYAVRPAP